jgi:hypothetical protein
MTVLLFIRDLVIATFGQLASLFAGVVVFGLIINFVSQCTFKSLEKAFGSRGIYLLAWLGTPLHELGHALFCVVFFHKIVEMKLFSPDPVNGTLGYVKHTWNKKNPWQVLGNFFIGIGPIILGSAVLFGVFYLLIPGSSSVWSDMMVQSKTLDNHAVGSYVQVWGNSSLAIIKLIFTLANLAGWRFWVFLYLAVCISSNIRLSWADFKHTFSGLGCVVLPFLILNLIGLLIGSGGETLFPVTAASLGGIYGVLILALVMALVGFIIIYLLSAIYYRMRYRTTLKPF